MIKVGKFDIGAVNFGRFPIQAVYLGKYLIWEEESAASGLACFSCGYWEDSLPWVDTEIWVDNT